MMLEDKLTTQRVLKVTYWWHSLHKKLIALPGNIRNDSTEGSYYVEDYGELMEDTLIEYEHPRKKWTSTKQRVVRTCVKGTHEKILIGERL